MGARNSFKEKEVKKLLKMFGCIFLHRGTGSHEIRYNPANKKPFTLAFHAARNIKEGTLKGILQRAGIDENEFLKAAGKAR